MITHHPATQQMPGHAREEFDGDSRLRLLEERRTSMVEAMGAISLRFARQLGIELGDRWERIVRLFIVHRPEVVTAQGHNGLARLKENLRRLQGCARETAMAHLQGPEAWPHLDGDGLPEGLGGRPKSCRVTKPIRRAEQEVLALLEPMFGIDDWPWLNNILGELSTPLSRMSEAYDRLGRELTEVESELVEVRHQMAIEAAQRLWDEA